jgi:hypothetical protein
MKKTILLLVVLSMLFSSLLLCADEAKPAPVQHSFGYVDIGVGPLPLPLPSFGAGFRKQADHHGADLSVQVETVVLLTQVKGSALYHYYFTPDLASQFYTGAGLGLSGLISHKKHMKGVLLSPEFVFGKQYQTERGSTRFFQAAISWPTYSFSNKETFKMPLVVFSYGIGF